MIQLTRIPVMIVRLSSPEETPSGGQAHCVPASKVAREFIDILRAGSVYACHALPNK
jgi:hypothetical protein